MVLEGRFLFLDPEMQFCYWQMLVASIVSRSRLMPVASFSLHNPSYSGMDKMVETNFTKTKHSHRVARF
jgi:hypothetical protein